jgi:transposase InsO family protein
MTSRSDRGGEFLSHEFIDWLKTKGIKHHLSAPHVHQQNGHAERLNNTLLEKAECMRLHASCPKSWWEFVLDTALHVYNHTPLHRTNWITPFENITKKQPDVHYFKTFGCAAYVHIPREKRKDKLFPKSELMTFIGYANDTKAY